VIPVQVPVGRPVRFVALCGALVERGAEPKRQG